MAVEVKNILHDNYAPSYSLASPRDNLIVLVGRKKKGKMGRLLFLF